MPHQNNLSIPVVIFIGAAIGAVTGLSIFFSPGEPYPLEIFVASTLRVALVGLLTGLTLKEKGSWLRGLGYGLLFAFLTGLVVFLAKGGFKSMDAPYVVPSALVTGSITGLLVTRFGFRKQRG